MDPQMFLHTQLWFHPALDHFNSSNPNTISVRYFVDATFFDPANPVMFFMMAIFVLVKLNNIQWVDELLEQHRARQPVHAEYSLTHQARRLGQGEALLLVIDEDSHFLHTV